jgi:hypothetical protein
VNSENARLGEDEARPFETSREPLLSVQSAGAARMLADGEVRLGREFRGYRTSGWHWTKITRELEAILTGFKLSATHHWVRRYGMRAHADDNDSHCCSGACYDRCCGTDPQERGQGPRDAGTSLGFSAPGGKANAAPSSEADKSPRGPC